MKRWTIRVAPALALLLTSVLLAGQGDIPGAPAASSPLDPGTPPTVQAKQDAEPGTLQQQLEEAVIPFDVVRSPAEVLAAIESVTDIEIELSGDAAEHAETRMACHSESMSAWRLLELLCRDF